MKLLYSKTSPYSRKVRMVIHEKGLQQTITSVTCNPFEEVAELEAANPLGKVPTLILDDGTSLYDSPVICAYLDTLSPDRLIPESGSDSNGQRWSFLCWEALADGMTDAAYNIVMERRRPPTQQSAEWLGRWAADIERALQQMEVRIGEIGRDVTLAHLAAGAAIGYLDLRMPEILYEAACPQSAAYPRLLQWYESFRLHPSMQSTVPA